VRVFAGHEAKMNALRDALRAAAARGCAILVALRTPEELNAVIGPLKETKSFAGLVSGRGDDAERAALAALDRAGSVVATLYPAERNVRRDGNESVPLHLVIAELHDAQRHVEQIRQCYQANSCETLLALEDEATKARLGPVVSRLARAGLDAHGELPPAQSRWIARLAQREAERALRLAREEAMSAERHLGELLAFSGWRE
jgi:3-methyladenine DNA glycosylase/8-oxoguanine DNA glycosylase